MLGGSWARTPFTTWNSKGPSMKDLAKAPRSPDKVILVSVSSWLLTSRVTVRVLMAEGRGMDCPIFVSTYPPRTLRTAFKLAGVSTGLAGICEQRRVSHHLDGRVGQHGVLRLGGVGEVERDVVDERGVDERGHVEHNVRDFHAIPARVPAQSSSSEVQVGRGEVAGAGDFLDRLHARVVHPDGKAGGEAEGDSAVCPGRRVGLGDGEEREAVLVDDPRVRISDLTADDLRNGSQIVVKLRASDRPLVIDELGRLGRSELNVDSVGGARQGRLVAYLVLEGEAEGNYHVRGPVLDEVERQQVLSPIPVGLSRSSRTELLRKHFVIVTPGGVLQGDQTGVPALAQQAGDGDESLGGGGDVGADGESDGERVALIGVRVALPNDSRPQPSEAQSEEEGL
eukprot:59639-Hanusia_phi.AAC.2